MSPAMPHPRIPFLAAVLTAVALQTAPAQEPRQPPPEDGIFIAV